MTDDPHIDAADLGRIDVPALVVVGRRDVVRREHTRLIASSLPRGRLATLERGGHMLPVTHPQHLARVVEAFLTER
jgi:pimeloyl-ACP methyl ester carboxylesterase